MFAGLIQQNWRRNYRESIATMPQPPSLAGLSISEIYDARRYKGPEKSVMEAALCQNTKVSRTLLRLRALQPKTQHLICRKPGWYQNLNKNRLPALEAVVGHLVGHRVHTPCDHCLLGSGGFQHCVIVPMQQRPMGSDRLQFFFRGDCTNCHLHSRRSPCSFRR